MQAQCAPTPPRLNTSLLMEGGVAKQSPQHSSHTVPVQLPYSTRTVPVVKTYSSHTSSFTKGEPLHHHSLYTCMMYGNCVFSQRELYGYCTGTVRVLYGNCPRAARWCAHVGPALQETPAEFPPTTTVQAWSRDGRHEPPPRQSIFTLPKAQTKFHHHHSHGNAKSVGIALSFIPIMQVCSVFCYREAHALRSLWALNPQSITPCAPIRPAEK